jgi:hypothetical protein
MMDMLTAFNRGLDGIHKALTPEDDYCDCHRCRPAPRYAPTSDMPWPIRFVLWVLKMLAWFCAAVLLGLFMAAIINTR